MPATTTCTRALLTAALLILGGPSPAAAQNVTASQIREAFAGQSLNISETEADSISSAVERAHRIACDNKSVGGNSKVGFAAVEIAEQLALNTKRDPSVATRIENAVEHLPCVVPVPIPPPRPFPPDLSWEQYFNETIALNSNAEFIRLVGEKKFSPVHISWEDIGRYQNSVWGDRISDVGIWVRKNEHDLSTAQLALSVRRDANFSDKVLVVPIEQIKVHSKEGSQTVEKTLLERLRELNLTSANNDRNVIVSNQFAIVPVPGQRPELRYQDLPQEAPRAAFNFSIYPYGSTNYVITDVIEGSSEAIVGPGYHQLLYYNNQGQKAPFTASRAAERRDLLQLESELKSKGMDVDVQRYYLIQIPLRRDASGIALSNLGAPPFPHYFLDYSAAPNIGMPAGAMPAPMEKAKSQSEAVQGLSKVAIGHGEDEGSYFGGSGYQGARANEPIRVTVVYFVTPVGKISRADMEAFSRSFEEWDSRAIWGGSFVVK